MSDLPCVECGEPVEIEQGRSPSRDDVLCEDCDHADRMAATADWVG